MSVGVEGGAGNGYGQSFENVDIGNPHEAGGSIVSGGVTHQKTIGEGGIPHTTVFAQQNRKIPEWFLVLKHFKTSPNCMAFLAIAWLMGVGIGLIFTFLFWHLQDFGGSPTLFGLASVINHVSEVFAYFFSSTFISQLGHVKVLCIGLLCNVLRFLYITILRNPWWVLPFEFVQGITHAACWAACSSYLAHNTPPELRHQAQSVLQGLYGLLCLIALVGFAVLNFYRKDVGGFISELPQEEDPHLMMGGGNDGGGTGAGHLAPHGVPGSIPRVPSNARLDEQRGAAGQFDYNSQQQYSAGVAGAGTDPNFYQQGYAAPQAQGGAAPATNPFFQ
ncbi:Major facilitator superfamily domain-containing protein 6 [Orchesella cincta]|uniref:Major facilitator superfamily domain-containing protein 6 n=1 Tax=Orchesella cincta TaxID=48709 RepID=A0A1D2N345_ORCCI|nr:Major facilitator superfamily domain-containing protein 6 [Orchesella cincta]